MKTKKVLIVGGGSAGWIAAAYLNAALNRGDRKRVDISLVESPDVDRIGVGEATIPNINHLLAVIGLDEQDFMSQVDGTFKQSIRYVNWLENRGEYYYHPFSRYRVFPIDPSGTNWLMSDRSIPFMETVSTQPVICELGLSPRSLDPHNPGPPLTYAFHIDALKFADYLCKFSKARGVTHYLDHVVDADMKDNGHIAAVTTKSGKRIEADIFVDCTGFAALLMEKKLGVKLLDCSQWLLCNRAVTMHVPYGHHYPGYVRPFTTASALSAGWVWEIPLRSTRSLGYVHSSIFISKADAEAELRGFEGRHSAELSTRFIDFTVGRRERVWEKNCISIGLAGGFIEPLESTGLYLSNLASVMLAEHFPYGDDLDAMAFRVNRILANRFYEILDFINMHYCLTRREDSEFWREVRRPERINDRLHAKLEFWKRKPPSPSDFEDQFFPGQSLEGLSTNNFCGDQRPPVDTAGLWNHESYEAILYGMDFLSEESRKWFGDSRPKPKIQRRLLEDLQAAPKVLPRHETFLQQALGMPNYPKAAG